MIPKVYILLPVHNRRALTALFVDSLVKQTYSNYHLILIDDGSTDGTAEMVQARITNLTVLKGNGDWWWARSLQEGLNWLKKNTPLPSDIVLMINDDVSFGPEFIENGVGFMQKYPQTLLLSRFYDVKQGKVIETGVSADFRRMSFPIAVSQETINCLTTRGLFLRWDACMMIGGFRTFMLPHYGSDSEYTIRAGRKGFALRTSPDVYLVPVLEATGIRGAHNSLKIKELFSIKYWNNPIYWSSFILLTCPARWIPINLAKVWVNILRIIKVKVLRIIKKGW